MNQSNQRQSVDLFANDLSPDDVKGPRLFSMLRKGHLTQGLSTAPSAAATMKSTTNLSPSTTTPRRSTIKSPPRALQSSPSSKSTGPTKLEPLELRFARDILDDETSLARAKHVAVLSAPPASDTSDSAAAGMVADPETVMHGIQAAWNTFARLSDQDKGVFLRGILAQCGKPQVEKICKELNLKLSTNGTTANAPVHVHPPDTHSMLARANYNRVSLSFSNLHSDGDPASPPPRPSALDPSSPPPRAPTNPAITNANMYLKLFPDPQLARSDALLAHDPATIRRVADLTAARCAKLEATLTALNRASASADIHGAGTDLMSSISTMLGAQLFTIYSFTRLSSTPTSNSTTLRPSDSDSDSAAPIASVECSNWLAPGTQVHASMIFGYAHHADHAGTALLNVFHATASDLFTNACHELYPPGTHSFLSAAIVNEAGELAAVIEVINKSGGGPAAPSAPEVAIPATTRRESKRPSNARAAAPTAPIPAGPTAAPFFDVEDEFVMQSTLATWRLILAEARAENERDHRAHQLRAILADLQGMSQAETLSGLLKMAETSIARLVGAEKVAVVLDMATLDVDAAEAVRVRRGEPVMVAHAMTQPGYRARGVRNLLLVPIFGHQGDGQVKGVISTQNKVPDYQYFIKQDLDNLVALSPLIAVLIYRAQRTHATNLEMLALRKQADRALDTLAAQDAVAFRVTKDLWISEVFTGASFMLFSVHHDQPVPHSIDTRHAVFYDDLTSALSTRTLRCNSLYPLHPPSRYDPTSSPTTTTPPSPPLGYIDYVITPSSTVPDEAIVVIRHASAARQAASWRSTLFAEHVALALVKDPTAFESGCRDQATAVVVNLAGFSMLALMLAPAQVGAVLTEYYAAVAEAARGYGGSVLPTANDKVYIIFGLPMACPDDASRAIQASLLTLSTLATRLPAKLAALGYPHVRVRATAALASGLVTGTLAGVHPVTFAAVGEPVHLVAKVDAAARVYGAPLLMDAATHECAKRYYELREVDLVSMPGSSSAANPTDTADGVGDVPTTPLTPVYDVIAAVNQMMDNDRRTGFICYELGLGEYRLRNFDAALTYFRKCKSLMPDDGPAAVMIDRCRRAVEEPGMVPVEWDGLWRWD
ncbi:hypothetical protein GGF31_008505 [Allomyces arbusculus]|nr:hypothetical protein GGF31_008505 [Allomyces arbusculus]